MSIQREAGYQQRQCLVTLNIRWQQATKHMFHMSVDGTYGRSYRSWFSRTLCILRLRAIGCLQPMSSIVRKPVFGVEYTVLIARVPNDESLTVA